MCPCLELLSLQVDFDLYFKHLRYFLSIEEAFRCFGTRNLRRCSLQWWWIKLQANNPSFSGCQSCQLTKAFLESGLHMNPHSESGVAYPVPLELQFRQRVPRIGGQNCMCHSPEWSAYIYRCQSKITLIKTLVAVPTLGEQHLTQRACACDQPPWTFLLKDLGIFSTFRHRVEVQLRETCRGLAWRPQNVQNIWFYIFLQIITRQISPRKSKNWTTFDDKGLHLWKSLRS